MGVVAAAEAAFCQPGELKLHRPAIRTFCASGARTRRQERLARRPDSARRAPVQRPSWLDFER